MRRSAVIAANDFALLRKDPLATIILIVMPFVVMGFVKPAHAPVLREEGYGFANGAEQVVPGMAQLFAYFMVTFAGMAFFREHIWNTWDRLRALPVKPREIIVGKVVPAFLIICTQQLILFSAGSLLFDLDVRGSLLALVLVVLAFAIWLMAFILVTVTFCRTFQQVLAVANAGAVLFAGFGGALTYIETLPGWAQAIAPVTPTYWAMDGFNSVFLDGEGVGGVAVPLAVLLGSAVVMFVLFALRYRLEAEKGGTL